jgi:serine/threonine protein kinase/Tfp pilus assembly protein PilF
MTGTAAGAGRWARVEELFRAALAASAADRATLLAACRRDDAEVAAEVEALLAADRDAGTFLAAVIDPDSPPPTAGFRDGMIGRRLGPYRVERELGRGGMSIVYLAVRDDEQFRRQVAIKLLQAGGGLDGEDMLRRFSRERRILAALEHPHIARLFDGGTLDDGRPYFVLERIEGEPLDEFCDRRRLGVTARLRLFLRVCSAIAYAHRNLVVHRDLKPTNVLVTADGSPKLLDFGIAKLLDPEGGPGGGGGAADPTRAELRVMTPGYASPEQRRGGVITTASDIYSLGVILFELLTGHRPPAPDPGRASLSVLVMQQAVNRRGRTVRLTPEAVAGARGCQPRELHRRLQGDLDNILAMALREDPERRYPSVEQLAGDLERHLGSRPVLARPDTFTYRAAKYLRRHRLGVAAGAGLACLLGAFIVAAAVQSARTARERDKAEQSLRFVEELFQVADPSEAQGNTITARELLDHGAARVEGRFEGQPQVAAALEETLGRIYGKLGIYGRAERLLTSALGRRRKASGSELTEVAATLNSLGDVLQLAGEYDRAEAAYREALALRRELLGARHPDVAESLNNLGDLLEDKGDYRGAEPLLRQALALRRDLFGAEHTAVAESLNNLGLLLHERADYRGAEPLLRQALAIRRRLLGANHPETAESLNNLAALLQAKGSYREAEPLLRDALMINRRVLGERHAGVAASLQNLAMVLHAEGKAGAAEPLLREALAIERQAVGADHPDRAASLHDLGLVLAAQGKTREAEDMFRQAIALYRRRLPAGHPYLAHPLVALGRLLAGRGDGAAAEPLLAEGLAIRRHSLPAGNWRIAEAAGALGVCEAKLGRRVVAEALLAESLESFRRALGDGDARTREARARLASLRGAG